MQIICSRCVATKEVKPTVTLPRHRVDCLISSHQMMYGI